MEDENYATYSQSALFMELFPSGVFKQLHQYLQCFFRVSLYCKKIDSNSSAKSLQLKKVVWYPIFKICCNTTLFPETPHATK